MSKFKPRMFCSHDFKFMGVVWQLTALPFVAQSHSGVYSFVSLFVVLLACDKKIRGALAYWCYSLQWLCNESQSGNFHLLF